MLEFLFLDIDETILDFHKAERIALSATLSRFGVEPTEAVCARYSAINRAHWEALERRELTRQQVVLGRFETLFRQLGVTADIPAVSECYETLLSKGHWYLPGAQEALQRLCGRYKLYLASNGTAKVQLPRLESAGLRQYFCDIFISEQLGADKPSPEYFDRCFARIPGFDRSRAMIVGDSLTSDILGGINAGITTCWLNPHAAPGQPDIRPDYELESLAGLEELLERIHANSTSQRT